MCDKCTDYRMKAVDYFLDSDKLNGGPLLKQYIKLMMAIQNCTEEHAINTANWMIRTAIDSGILSKDTPEDIAKYIYNGIVLANKTGLESLKIDSKKAN